MLNRQQESMITYCRGYSGGTTDVRKTGQVPTRCGAQCFLPHSSPVIPLPSRHLSSAVLPLPGLPRPRLSLSIQGAQVHGSPSFLIL